MRCLEVGADRDKADDSGRTPIHFDSGRHLQVVRCLLEVGADQGKADSEGVTPLSFAFEGGHMEVARCSRLSHH